jgi:glycerol uptake facilitator protein
MTPFVGEIIGTMVLIILGNGVNAGVTLNKSHAQSSGWIVITLGWGLAVTLGVYAVGQISGAHLNPAVTLGLAFSGAFEWSSVPSYILAQMIGGVLGATIVWLHYLPHWGNENEPASQLGVFSTAPGVRSKWANLLSEVIGTFILLSGLLFIGANTFTEGLNPIVVGALIVAIGMSLGGTTGYAINPARDLGPRIAHFILPIKGKGDSDWGYSWVPVVGPIIGGILGAVMYMWLFKGVTSVVLWIAIAVTLVIILLAVNENKGKD